MEHGAWSMEHGAALAITSCQDCYRLCLRRTCSKEWGGETFGHKLIFLEKRFSIIEWMIKIRIIVGLISIYRNRLNYALAKIKRA